MKYTVLRIIVLTAVILLITRFFNPFEEMQDWKNQTQLRAYFEQIDVTEKFEDNGHFFIKGTLLTDKVDSDNKERTYKVLSKKIYDAIDLAGGNLTGVAVEFTASKKNVPEEKLEEIKTNTDILFLDDSYNEYMEVSGAGLNK